MEVVVVVGGGELWKPDDVMGKTPTGAGIRGQSTHQSDTPGINASTGTCERFREEYGRDAWRQEQYHRGGGRRVGKPYI